jgi:two-component system, NarL family, sensor histidine kinase DesK
LSFNAHWATTDAVLSEEQRRRLAQTRWRRPAAFFLVYLIYALQALFKDHSISAAIFGCAIVAVYSLVYIFMLPKAAFGGPTKYRALVLAIMGSLLILYGVLFHEGSVVLLAYFSVAVASVAPARYALAWVLLITPSVIFLPQHISGWNDVHGNQYGLAMATSLGALATLGLRRNVRDNIELGETREELAQLAAEQERIRIARDIHDLLGHSLTTVIMKSELAARLVERDPNRAVVEMHEVAELARQGLSDVRATVTGYRSVSLASELATAREVLRSAGIEADLPTAADVVPPERQEVFGWVLREGVTNAVRHSGAQRLTVRLSPSSIEIADDGNGGDPNRPGNGLSGLNERLIAAGGSIITRLNESGGFCLRAEVNQ